MYTEVSELMIARRATIIISCYLASAGMAVCGQKTSSAAKADSPVREIVRTDVKVLQEPPEKYRGAVKRLGLDYKILLDRFEAVKSTGHPQTFRNIIIAHIIARNVKPSEFDPAALRIVELMQTGDGLEKSLRLALFLDPPAIRRYKHAAEKELRSVF